MYRSFLSSISQFLLQRLWLRPLSPSYPHVTVSLHLLSGGSPSSAARDAQQTAELTAADVALESTSRACGGCVRSERVSAGRRAATASSNQRRHISKSTEFKTDAPQMLCQASLLHDDWMFSTNETFKKVCSAFCPFNIDYI